jgi:hypothetical protein
MSEQTPGLPSKYKIIDRAGVVLMAAGSIGLFSSTISALFHKAASEGTQLDIIGAAFSAAALLIGGCAISKARDKENEDGTVQKTDGLSPS